MIVTTFRSIKNSVPDSLQYIETQCLQYENDIENVCVNIIQEILIRNRYNDSTIWDNIQEFREWICQLKIYCSII